MVARPQNNYNVEGSVGLGHPESPADEDPNEENTKEQKRKTKSYEESKRKTLKTGQNLGINF